MSGDREQERGALRILLLTQFYWPEERTAPTNLAFLAEDLERRGHRVTVVTGFPNHPFGRIYDGYRMRWRQWDEVRGVSVLRLPLFPDHSGSHLRRAVNYLSFATAASTLGAWLTRKRRFDVLLVYLPPLTNLLPIQVLQWLHRVPMVCWETDLWPDALIATGNQPVRPVRWALELLDRLVHRRAEAVCVNSPGLARRLAGRGVPERKLRVITDWADESLFFVSERSPELEASHGLAGRFNVMYAGNFGPAQDLGTVLEAAQHLRDLEDLQLVLIGSGEEEKRLRQLARSGGLENVRFIDRQPMSRIHRFFASADVLLVHLRPDPLFEAQIPSKTMAYLASGRPILCAVEGSAAEVVQRAGAGETVAPGSPEAMAAALRRLHELPPEQLCELGRNGRKEYERRYTRARQVEAFEEVLTEATRA